jgi:COP9 signalosome complex subunit 6
MLPIHTRIQELHNDSPILLLFHPADAIAEVKTGGKLPLTLYESINETGAVIPNDKAMDIDGAATGKLVKFLELVYTVETGEAEMIGVDFVARGGGNATAVEGTKPTASSSKAATTESEDSKKGKGKAKEVSKTEGVIDESTILTAEDEESASIYLSLPQIYEPH